LGGAHLPEDPKQTLEEYRALPRKTQRVMVRERVPQEVVEEVVRSRRAAPNGKLPDMMLHIYLRRSGGDAIV
jgi:hypothetical protein